MLSVVIPVRITKEAKDFIERRVRERPDKFDSVAHYIRVALIQMEIREK